MDKYIESLAAMPNGFLHIAKSYAVDNSSPKIEPAHLLRALLHKKTGLAAFIETTLDSDYYYLVDWADIRMQQTPRSAYPMKEAELSDESRSTVRLALQLAERAGTEGVTPEILLAALATPGTGFTFDQLKTLPLDSERIMKHVAPGANADSTPRAAAASGYSSPPTPGAESQDTYITDLLEEAPAEEPVEQEEKIRTIMETLSRRDKANVLIVGETGVGKTSLIASLLRHLRQGDVPKRLKELHPFELDLISLTQGVSYKGELEDRFKEVENRLMKYGSPLLVIENFHRIEEKQSLLGGLLAPLKKLLSKNRLQVICTSTVDGYTKDIEHDKEFLSYVEKVNVEEPDEELAVEILDRKIPAYSEFHEVETEEGISAALVRLAKRYLPEKKLPSSAIDLLDRAMAAIKIKSELDGADGSRLTADAVKDVVSAMTGIPIGSVQSEERDRLQNAEETLHRRVVGQNHAVKSILDAIYESRSGLNKKGQPTGSFFFLGPTGTGKTELAKALAEFLFQDETAILRFDMSEYKEEHSVALLYGAPPGYVGYEEGGLLVNQIRQKPYSVVLFDEIEKAHRSVFDLFLQILDEGKLHDRLGRVGDFSNALIIFTSNIGSDYIFKQFEAGRVPTHDQMLEVMQGQFRPEFLARLTEIVPFSPITPEMIEKIFSIHVKNLVKSLEEQNVRLEIDRTAMDYITKVGFNTHYGARPVLGIIRKEIRRPLSKMLIAGTIEPGDVVTMKHSPETGEMIWEID